MQFWRGSTDLLNSPAALPLFSHNEIMRRLIALLLFASLALLAQAPARRPAARSKPQQPASSPVIETVRAEGATRLSETEIIRLSGIKSGMQPTNAVFEAARDRLLATGCIETISWRFGPSASGTGYDAVLSITEPDQFLPWAIDRLPLTEAEFAAAASRELPCFGKELPTYESYLTRAAALVQRLLAAKGANAEAIAKVGLPDGKTLTIVFQPSTPPPNIYDVQFTGNKAIPGPELRKPVAQLAIGLPYSENLFRQMLENQARPLYEAIGRLTVQFPNVTLKPPPDPAAKGVLVIIEVDEGPTYALDDIKFEGSPIDEVELEKLGQFNRGKVINYSEIGLGMERILAEIRERGYLKCSYTARRRLDTEKKAAFLTVTIDPGAQFVMGKLFITGLDVVTEPAIRKIWAMPEGQTFRAGYPDFFLREVRTRGILDFLGETRSSIKANDETRRVDVTLSFKGGAMELDSRQVTQPRPPRP